MLLRQWQTVILRKLKEGRATAFNGEQQLSCNISTTSQVNLKYYDALGLTPKATHSDIKVTYYKLAMLYHPDKNKGNEAAAQRFKDISEAYEVLGNFRLRKLYDKGIIHSAGSQYAQAQHYPEEKEDDPQTKFYTQHMKKSKVPPATGRTPIYDFDEWSKQHYGTQFERRQAAMRKRDKKQEQRNSFSMSVKKELLIFGILSCVVACILISYEEYTHDVDITKKKS